MMRFKRILFPVDFSPRSRGAAVYANALAERFESEITPYKWLMPEMRST
jgi:hypothetical protein